MDTFSDVYTKCINVLRADSLSAEWSSIQGKLRDLMAGDGPSDAKRDVLNEVRTKLANAGKTKARPKTAAAEEILKASKTASTGYHDRAAMIKAIRHLYFVRKKGNQSVWVVDLPKSYGKWTFDQFAGKTEVDLKAELQQESEVFGEANRNMMSDALQLARKWSTDIQTKLASPDAATLVIVRRWFHEGSAKDADVKATAATLHDGFKKIAATCNSTRVIFSDRPHKRVSGTYETTFASVNSADAMPVIYIFKLFLDTGKRNALGNIGKLWLCALTVIHELSHKKVGTSDVKYDDDGLKPGVGFTTVNALDNADSWGYFAADMVGAIPRKTFKAVYR